MVLPHPPPNLKHRTIVLWTKRMKPQKQSLSDRVMEGSISGTTQKAAMGKSEGDHRAPFGPCLRHKLLSARPDLKPWRAATGSKHLAAGPRRIPPTVPGGGCRLSELAGSSAECAATSRIVFGAARCRLPSSRRKKSSSSGNTSRRAQLRNAHGSILKTGAPEAVW